jgi:hypothetical protein
LPTSTWRGLSFNACSSSAWRGSLHADGAEHEEAFGVGIDQCIILEKTGAFGQFLAAEFRLGRHAPFELRVGF